MYQLEIEYNGAASILIKVRGASVLPEVAASGVAVSRGDCTPGAFAANVEDSRHKDDDPGVTTATGSTVVELDTS